MRFPPSTFARKDQPCVRLFKPLAFFQEVDSLLRWGHHAEHPASPGGPFSGSLESDHPALLLLLVGVLRFSALASAQAAAALRAHPARQLYLRRVLQVTRPSVPARKFTSRKLRVNHETAFYRLTLALCHRLRPGLGIDPTICLGGQPGEDRHRRRQRPDRHGRDRPAFHAERRVPGTPAGAGLASPRAGIFRVGAAGDNDRGLRMEFLYFSTPNVEAQ